MNVRKAVLADKSKVAELYKNLFTESAKMQPLFYKEAEIEDDFLTKVIKDDSAALFVAEEAGCIVGFVLALEEATQPFGCVRRLKYAYLLDIIVKEEYRGKGITAGLVECVKIWAKEKGLHHISLTVLEENERAIASYEKEGFYSAMRTMRYVL